VIDRVFIPGGFVDHFKFDDIGPRGCSEDGWSPPIVDVNIVSPETERLVRLAELDAADRAIITQYSESALNDFKFGMGRFHEPVEKPQGSPLLLKLMARM
jgi:hypothetical protein